jgi:transposase-like protein
MAAANRLFDKAMQPNGDPEKVAMDERGANKAAIDSINAGRDVPVSETRDRESAAPARRFLSHGRDLAQAPLA